MDDLKCNFEVGMKVIGMAGPEFEGDCKAMISFGGKYWTVEFVDIDHSRDGHAYFQIRFKPESGYRDRSLSLVYRDDTVPILLEDNEKCKKDFPHKCTWCGKQAYIGLFEISHMDDSVNCTARRG